MKSKKVFRMSLIFLIEFRLAFLVFLSSFPLILMMTVEWFIDENKPLIIIIGLSLEVFFFWVWKTCVVPTILPVAFGKLIVTDEGVEYRCLFKKPSYISWSDCKFCGIESYHSDVADLYGTGRRYVYFSTRPIPRERRNKLDMMKNDNELIKFFPVTKKLCNEILLHKSVSDIRHALFQNEIKW